MAGKSTRRVWLIALALLTVGLAVPFLAWSTIGHRRADEPRVQQTPTAHSPDRKILLVLDNYGGVAHGGMRITAYDDGICTIERYTDVGGDSSIVNGTCRLDESEGRLELTASDDGRTLQRVHHGGQVYWVQPEDTARLASDEIFRSMALRQVHGQ